MTLEEQLLGFLQNIDSKIKTFDKLQAAVNDGLEKLKLAVENGKMEIDISDYQVIKDIQAQSKKLGDSITDLQTQAANLATTVSANALAVTKAEESREKMNERIDGLSNTSVTHGARLNKIDDNISSIQNNISTLESSATSNKSAIDLLKTNAESFRLGTSERIDGLSTASTAHDTHLTKIDDNITNIGRSISAIEFAVASNKSAVDSLKTSAESLHSQVNAITPEKLTRLKVDKWDAETGALHLSIV